VESNPLHKEKELLLRVAVGEEQAFRQLFEQYQAKLGGYVFNWTKSAVTAAEIVQDIFLKVWINKAALAQVENFDKYLYVISRNYTYNALRKVARERLQFKHWLQQAELETGEDAFPDVPVNYTPLIAAAVALLPAQQKKVYELRYQHNLKYEVIGQQMGIAPETARKHMQAATRAIAAYLKEQLPVLLILSAVAQWR
jgi:RNA polymerase sigma-70 factor (ECF subfamily)